MLLCSCREVLHNYHTATSVRKDACKHSSLNVTVDNVGGNPGTTVHEHFHKNPRKMAKAIADEWEKWLGVEDPTDHRVQATVSNVINGVHTAASVDLPASGCQTMLSLPLPL